MVRIVVGVDGSEASVRALQWAMKEARLRGATLDVVHAWHLPPAGGYPYLAGYLDLKVFEEDAQRTLARTLGRAGVAGAPEVEPIVVQDAPRRALVDTAKGADLLVVGSRGRGGFTGLLLGSVGQYVATHAPCPVAIIP